MKTKQHAYLFSQLSFFALLLFVSTANADISEQDVEDKTLSPYFLVKSDDPQVDQLPLKSTGAEVSIAGVIADVTVTQVYKNEGKRPLEAVYVFPASTRAAVYGMKMTIGERTIVATIETRKKAREDYEAAKQAGQSASLLEQQRPNVFQMNVANIMPGDLIKVELKYTELLIPTEGIYEFMYPTVVGPRYSETPEAGATDTEKWIKNPYLHEGEAPPYVFDINVDLAAGMPIQEVRSSSHNVDVDFPKPSRATVTLSKGDKTGGNRDYILNYRLSGGQIESGLLLYEGKDENFFLLMAQPPKRVAADQIPPREYIFIVDVSGSMHGFPLEVSKKLLRKLIGNLKPTDTFNVLLFAGRSKLMADKSVPATAENIERAMDVIDRQRGGGGTRLLPALERALKLPRTANTACSIIVVTDGYVAVELEALELIRERLGEANLFAFGIGSSVNRFIIEGMARAGMGEPFIVTKQGEAAARAEKFRSYIQTPVLSNVNVAFEGFDVHDVEPISIPDVLAERPVIVFGKSSSRPTGYITLTGTTGSGSYQKVFAIDSVSPLESNAALRYLWARNRIAMLADYIKLGGGDERVKQVTELGIKYNLLTAYTSFVAVDSVVRNVGGEQTTVKQPLPLPQGVSDRAVGNASLMRPKAATFGAGTATRQISSYLAAEEDTATPRKISVKSVPEKTTVTGTLSRIEVEKVVNLHLSDLEKCQRKTAPTLSGEVTLRFNIDSSGRASGLEVLVGQAKHEQFTGCLAEFMAKWRFPMSGGNTRVVYAVKFN